MNHIGMCLTVQIGERGTFTDVQIGERGKQRAVPGVPMKAERSIFVTLISFENITYFNFIR